MALSVRDLVVEYDTEEGPVRAVDRVSFDIEEGEIFGVVGVSGCGKSTLADAMIALLDDNGSVTGGSITYGERDLTTMSEAELTGEIRGNEIGTIFQDPTSSLDPVYTVGEQLVETLAGNTDLSGAERRERAVQLLAQVGIPNPGERFDDYPHSFSGGMRQRVVIAIALSANPGLLIADEPTTGLDVTIQAQILNLIRDVQGEYDTSVMIITHDLGVVAEICDRAAVMYAGNVVEIDDVQSLLHDPKHPYTQDLLRSLPEYHEIQEELSAIPGTPPSLLDPPAGCKYHPRCSEICSEACETGDVPPLYEANGAVVRCYLYDEDENPEYSNSGGVLPERGGGEP